VVAFVVLLAALLVLLVWDIGSNIGQEEPTVKVITLRGPTGDANVNEASEALREARTNGSVEAVVLRIDSPGGPVDSSEELYLAVNRTAAEMPVVAYVEGSAASGGYYGIAPADEIYVKPSSSVGSVGVAVQVPLSFIKQAEQQSERFVRSGPDKGQIDRDRIRQDIEQLQRSFIGTVFLHRGDDIELTREEVASGRTYLGAQAVQYGLADGVGDLDAAIEAAADRAEGIDGDQYDVAYDDQQLEVTLALEAASVEEVDGNVVFVTEDGGEATEIVQPVRYWAVWGIPVQEAATTENQETAPPENRETATTEGETDE